MSFLETGLLLVAGTAWLGGTCLANAVRCGRAHCWIDGVLLPGLSFAGGLNILGLVSFPWYTFTELFWVIVVVSFVAECATGPYLTGRLG